MQNIFFFSFNLLCLQADKSCQRSFHGHDCFLDSRLWKKMLWKKKPAKIFCSKKLLFCFCWRTITLWAKKTFSHAKIQRFPPPLFLCSYQNHSTPGFRIVATGEFAQRFLICSWTTLASRDVTYNARHEHDEAYLRAAQFWKFCVWLRFRLNISLF